jgi:hypothetical protein
VYLWSNALLKGALRYISAEAFRRSGDICEVEICGVINAKKIAEV